MMTKFDSNKIKKKKYKAYICLNCKFCQIQVQLGQIHYMSILASTTYLKHTQTHSLRLVLFASLHIVVAHTYTVIQALLSNK